jgi:hypothetical protein
VQMIEIILNDGCKLGNCVVCYKYESLDAPVASINMEDCSDSGG